MMTIHPYKPISKNVPSTDFPDNFLKPQCTTGMPLLHDSTVHCTACGKLVPVESCGNGPDNGLLLTGFIGYYGGFTDRLFDDHENQSNMDQLNNAWFCHNCCVKLFEMFPHLSKAIGIKGKYSHQSRHHPCNDDVPCCKYAWNVVRDPHNPDDPVDLYAYYNKETKKLEWRPLEPF